MIKKLINSYLSDIKSLTSSNANLKQQVSELMSTINVQQEVLSEAEKRESEYHNIRSKMESYYENKFKELINSNRNLNNDIESYKTNERHMKEDLDKKTNELNSLYGHVTALLSGGSDQRLVNPLIDLGSRSPEGKENERCETKDNLIIQDFDFIDVSVFDNTLVWHNWHDELILNSLNLHEIVTYGFFILQEKNILLFDEIMRDISKRHHILHETVMRSPQLIHRQTKPLLTPAHELVTTLLTCRKCTNDFRDHDECNNDNSNDEIVSEDNHMTKNINRSESLSLLVNMAEKNDLVRSSIDNIDNNGNI